MLIQSEPDPQSDTTGVLGHRQKAKPRSALVCLVLGSGSQHSEFWTLLCTHSVIRRWAMACFGGSHRMGGSPLLGGVFTFKAEVTSSRLNQRASSSSVWSTCNCTGNSRSHDNFYLLGCPSNFLNCVCLVCPKGIYWMFFLNPSKHLNLKRH